MFLDYVICGTVYGRTHVDLLKMPIFYTLYTGGENQDILRGQLSVISKEMIISGPEITPI